MGKSHTLPMGRGLVVVLGLAVVLGTMGCSSNPAPPQAPPQVNQAPSLANPVPPSGIQFTGGKK